MGKTKDYTDEQERIARYAKAGPNGYPAISGRTGNLLFRRYP